jgi:steroid delta-isomerase-like uncharacterized protein
MWAQQSSPGALSSPSAAAASQQEQNKAVARRVFAEIFNQGKFGVADEIYARDFVNHGLHRNFDLQQDQAAARWEKQIAPDLTITVDLMMAEGDLVTVVWTTRGTNTASVGGFPATGVKIEERGITVWRIVNGKICEEWTSFDLLHVVRQFASQLKWLLMGLLCVFVFLVWAVGRLLRKLWLSFSTRTANAMA